MPLAASNLYAAAQVSSAAHVTDALNPPAGSALLLVAGYSVVGGGTTGSGDSVTVQNCMATWTQIGHAHPAGDNRRGIFLLRGTGAVTNEAITVTVTAPTGTLETTFVSVNQVTGHNTTTPNDAAVVDYGGTGTASDANDLGTIDAGDLAFFAVAHETDETVTLESGTQLSHTTNATGLRTLTVGYSTDETPTASWATASSWLTVGAILNVATASATAELTGTAIGGITETDIQTGGRTIVITLVGDTFIPN